METKLIVVCGLMLVMGTVASAGGMLTLNGGTYTWTAIASADALVDLADMNTNYGDVNRIETRPLNLDAEVFAKKSYLRFDLPNNMDMVAANAVAYSLKLTAQADANSSYHNFAGRELRVWALSEYYDTWGENNITYRSALEYYGNCSSNVANSEYFIKDWNDIDPNYPYDPDANGWPGMPVIRGSWVDANHFDTARSVTWNLLNATPNTGLGSTNYVYTAGGWSPDPNTKNFLDVIALDTDQSISLLLCSQYTMYFQSREAPDEADQPTLVIQFVPEPATLTVLGLGALGLLRRRRS